MVKTLQYYTENPKDQTITYEQPIGDGGAEELPLTGRDLQQEPGS